MSNVSLEMAPNAKSGGVVGDAIPQSFDGAQLVVHVDVTVVPTYGQPPGLG